LYCFTTGKFGVVKYELRIELEVVSLVALEIFTIKELKITTDRSALLDFSFNPAL